VLIDWFTVGAQAINFLILVALLKHFLYGPILRAMDRREERIAKRFAEADEQLKEAEAREREYRQLQQDLEKTRGERLREIEREVETRRKELLKSAKEDAGNLRNAWLSSIRKERDDFFRELKKRVGVEVLHIARKSVLDLADAALERLLVKRFIKRFDDLQDEEREQMLNAARNKGLLVSSSFSWSDDMRRAFLDNLGDRFGQDIEIRFTTDPDMALGMEMAVGGFKLPWGVDHYFAELKKAVGELYDSHIEEAEKSDESLPDEHSEEEL